MQQTLEVQTLMNEPLPMSKKRGWFQFHLSTAIVVVLMAGGLMGANLLPQSVLEYQGCLSDGGAYDILGFGWPAYYLYTFGEEKTSTLRVEHWSYLALAIDLAILLILLAGTCFVWEWQVARRKRIKVMQTEKG